WTPARTPAINVTDSLDNLRPFVFFFFQAEDGIRDYKVTGVQTCALPICWTPPARSSGAAWDSKKPPSALPWKRPESNSAGPKLRSEERRVGKECRSRGGGGAYIRERRGSWRSWGDSGVGMCV